MNKTSLAALLLGCAIAGQAIAVEAPVPDSRPPNASYQLSAGGELFLAPDGTVADVKLKRDRGLTPEIAALVEKRVRSWRFEPVLVDGKAVMAKTRLNLSLRAEPVAGGYRLRVQGLGFGNPVHTNRMQPPEYPMAARRAGVEAQVVVIATLDADGNVADVEVGRTSLSMKGSPKALARWASVFEKTALAAAKQWKFQPSEVVDGRTVARTSVSVPIDYQMRYDNMPGGWHQLIPVPGRGIDDADAQMAMASLAQDGRPQALDPRFKLKDAVVGTLL